MFGRSPVWFSAVAALSACGEHGIEHLRYELLSGSGQLGNGFELLFELGRGAALGAAWGGGIGGRIRLRVTDQRFNRCAKQTGQCWQHGNRHPPAPHFIGSKLRLRDGEGIGELHLCQTGGAARCCDAAAKFCKIDAFIGGHGRVFNP